MKGDAVAGLLILFVNIFGGLILGVVSHGLSFGEAAETYIMLAIGDALVAQVPALLLSIAAAAIVTRVSSPLDLSGQISSQFGHASAWGPVAGILTLLGWSRRCRSWWCFPPPPWPGAIWWRLRKRRTDRARNRRPVDAARPPHVIGWDEVGETAPITLELGYGAGRAWSMNARARR